jgi:hypothetical protein
MSQSVVPERASVAFSTPLRTDDEEPDKTECTVADGRDAADLLAVELFDEESLGVSRPECVRVVQAGIPAFGRGEIEAEAELVAPEGADDLYAPIGVGSASRRGSVLIGSRGGLASKRGSMWRATQR